MLRLAGVRKTGVVYGNGRCAPKAMLAFPAAIKIYVALEPVDMRKQYDGLNSDM